VTHRYSPSMALAGNRAHMARVLAGVGASPGIRPTTQVADQQVRAPAPEPSMLPSSADPGPVSEKPSNLKWYIGGGIVLLVGVLLLLRQKRK